MRLLLESGAGKDLATSNGVTALRHASYKDHVEVVRLLIGSGAGQDLVGNDGATALMVAS